MIFDNNIQLCTLKYLEIFVAGQ